MARRPPTWRASTAAQPACEPCWTAQFLARWTWRPAITTVSIYRGARLGYPADLESISVRKAPGLGFTKPSPPSGLTALHVAVNTECQETVQLLLERGADIDAVVSAH